MRCRYTAVAASLHAVAPSSGSSALHAEHHQHSAGTSHWQRARRAIPAGQIPLASLRGQSSAGTHWPACARQRPSCSHWRDAAQSSSASALQRSPTRWHNPSRLQSQLQRQSSVLLTNAATACGGAAPVRGVHVRCGPKTQWRPRGALRTRPASTQRRFACRERRALFRELLAPFVEEVSVRTHGPADLEDDPTPFNYARARGVLPRARRVP